MLNSHRFLLPTVLGVTVHLVQIGCGPRVARPRTAAEPHDSGISAEEVREAVSVVEEFLAAAAGSDLEGMARLFGTAEGPAHKSTAPYEIQQRIFIMARLLAYDSMYVEPSAVPATAGRVRVTARLFGRREQPLEVPVVAVRYGGGWLVERVAVTDGRPVRRRVPRSTTWRVGAG